MPDLNQYDGITVSQEINDNRVTIKLYDASIDTWYYNQEGLPDYAPNLNRDLAGYVAITVADSEGKTLENYNSSYIKGKNEYTFAYFPKKNETLNIRGVFYSITGSQGPQTKYYKNVNFDAKYYTYPPTPSLSTVSVSTVCENPPITTFVGNYPSLSTISFQNSWYIDKANVSDFKIYHTLDKQINRLPTNQFYYELKNKINNADAKNIWNPNEFYIAEVENLVDGEWVNIKSFYTLDNTTFQNNPFQTTDFYIRPLTVNQTEEGEIVWYGSRLQGGIVGHLIDENFALYPIGNYKITIFDELSSSSCEFVLNIDDSRPPTTETPSNSTISLSEYNEIDLNYTYNNPIYFSHVNGEAFTLDGSDYVGFFNITNGEAYTEKVYSENSKLLSRKNTILSDFYISQYYFDSAYKNYRSELKNINISPNDILNLNLLGELIEKINNNNLICFKNLNIYNPYLVNYRRNENYYYGLSTLEQATIYKWNEISENWNNTKIKFGDVYSNSTIDTGIPAKTEYIFTRPFSENRLWAFLENGIEHGALNVYSSDNFEYFYTTSENYLYTLEGNFQSKSPLKLKSRVALPEKSYNIFFNDINQDLVLVLEDYISTYDGFVFKRCGDFKLLDRIKIENGISPSSIRFGKNYRIGLNDQDLIINNKYSSEDINTFKLSSINVNNVIDADIREDDDYILILHKKNEDVYVCGFHPDHIQDSFFNRQIYSIDINYNTNIIFSKIDSNVFHLKNEKTYQVRHINYPDYPASRLETADLMYNDITVFWNTFREKWNDNILYWNDSMNSSMIYNNFVVCDEFKNDNRYILLHNVGRIYVIKQDPNDRFESSIPLDTIKYFNGIQYNESSIGIYLNTILMNLLKDIINIHNKASNAFEYTESSVIRKKIENINGDLYDLFIHNNENINVMVLNRIFSNIYDIQNKLIAINS